MQGYALDFAEMIFLASVLLWILVISIPVVAPPQLVGCRHLRGTTA